MASRNQKVPDRLEVAWLNTTIGLYSISYGYSSALAGIIRSVIVWNVARPELSFNSSECPLLRFSNFD